MFFEINKLLCNTFNGLDPIKLLDYPAVDVIDLINNTISYNQRKAKNSDNPVINKSGVIRKKAGDNWF